jgi:hypothetical protein
MHAGARGQKERAVIAAVAGVAFVGLVASIEGSPLQPVQPAGAQPLPPFAFAARVAGLDGLGSTAQAVLGIVALASMTAAFLYALRAAWRGQLGVRLVTWVGVGFVVFATLLPLMLSRDVYSYSLYGRIASVHHSNPYVATPRQFTQDPIYPLVGPEWRSSTAVYGPAFMALATAITRFVHGPVALIWTFKAVAGAATIGMVVLVARLSSRLCPARAAFATALVAWNPVVLFHDVGGGHNDVLIGLAVVLAMWLLASPPRTEAEDPRRLDVRRTRREGRRRPCSPWRRW